MEPPIIVLEHGDVTIFESVTKAEIGLEPIDVGNGEYVAYDGRGHQLCLYVTRKEKPSFFGKKGTIESVEIRDSEEGLDCAYELRNALISFFKETEIYDTEDESLLLTDLVSKAVKQFGYAN